MSRPFLILPLLAVLSGPVYAVQQYGYKVIDRKPQARHTHVQGLEIADDRLYVSSGGFGKSRLLRLDFDSGAVQVERRLDPRLFAEGITLLGDRLYQLTWRAHLLLVYDRSDLRGIERWRIPGEGWGLTHDDEHLIYSDGSDRLFFISPAERRITRTLHVTEAGRPVTRLNELEWVEGRIWANIWQTDRIVIIDPATGDVEGSVNLQGLQPALGPDPATDGLDNVLNGIARNPADGGIWVTGKNWPWLYRIELVPQPAISSPPDPAKPR